jgi:hypothetical protein
MAGYRGPAPKIEASKVGRALKCIEAAVCMAAKRVAGGAEWRLKDRIWRGLRSKAGRLAGQRHVLLLGPRLHGTMVSRNREAAVNVGRGKQRRVRVQ